MSDKKNASFTVLPMVPLPPLPIVLPMPVALGWDLEDRSWNSDDSSKKSSTATLGSKADIKPYWEKTIDFQKSALELTKDLYDLFFTYISDMLDGLAESLPDDFPYMPSWAESPKAFRETMKEWEEMTNDLFKEQVDTLSDYVIKSQEKACDQIPEADKTDGAEVIEAEAEVVEKPAAAKPAAKTTRARTRTRTTRAKTS